MATTTPNLGLKKPNVTDKVNVSDLNGNADLIDAIIGRLSNLNTTQKDSLVAAINEALTSAGTAAGFGDPVATVDGNTGTPSVEVTASGPDTAKVFTFTFKNLKGAQGAQGEQGIPGSAGSDGITPSIGTNGNWYIGSTDTGKPSRGATGEKGDPGAAGKDGTTPHIGANGNWYIGDTDTGVSAGGSELPAVTADDAGKFLRVSSSGSWVAETVANANGGEF